MKAQKSMISYFGSSFLVTGVGFVLALAVGFYYSGNMAGAINALWIAMVLSILEVSISFDNAVVNATVLKDMSPLWQRRFLTWGMLIAVFGMRLVFPLAIVSIVAGIGPWEALVVAATQPEEYAKMMLSVHHEVSAFGGAFLMLVALKYFFDVNKDVHWVHMIEAPLVKIGRLNAIEVGIVLVWIYIMSHWVNSSESLPFMMSGTAGILTFIAVDAIGTFLQVPEANKHDVNKASIGMFLYLEVLDASFSFDGVVGAFAITSNLFIIAIGLGIGAMFVRSLTIMIVDRGSLDSFKYLEHGAFYAVGALAVIMFLNTVYHIPEAITGLVGAAFIGFSIWSSIKEVKTKNK